jgi:hypothetical protein
MDVSPQEHSKETSAKDTPEPDLDVSTPLVDEENTLQAPCEEPQISLHALYDFSTPETLKLSGYIKHHKVIVLINNDNTHNLFLGECM